MLRIAIDLDDTIFIWGRTHEKKFNCNLYNMTEKEITDQVKQCKYDKEFWSNLPLLERPDFEPTLYATKRINSKNYTKACLLKHSLPIKPIYQQTDMKDNKARIIKGHCDVLIDDSWFNVCQCLSVGFPALLITRDHNAHIDTRWRVNKLNYKEIEQKYAELSRAMQSKNFKY